MKEALTNAFVTKPVTVTWTTDKNTVTFVTMRLLMSEEETARRLSADNSYQLGDSYNARYGYNVVDSDNNIVRSGVSDDVTILVSGSVYLTVASLATLMLLQF